MSKKAPSVNDLVIPPRRMTGWGILYAALYLGGPVLAVLALIDLALWLLFTYGLESCYGIFCWL